VELRIGDDDTSRSRDLHIERPVSNTAQE
jgi:hypothetical protein